MIKKIVFRNLLHSTGLSYTAIGGIRFYNQVGNIIPCGTITTNNTANAETTNFSITATTAYASNYNVVYSFDDTKSQTGNYPNSYWLAGDNTNAQTITVTFKIVVDSISKIEFVPLPDSAIGDRNVGAFYIDVYNENNNLIITYPITPITTRNTVQLLLTPELKFRKTQVNFSSNPINIYPNVYINKENKLSYQIVHPEIKKSFTETNSVVSTVPTTLGSGKMFSLPIDQSRWANISDIIIK